MAVCRELRRVNVKFLFSNPEKAHPCAEPRCLTIMRKIGSGAFWKKPSEHFEAQFRAYGEKKPLEGS